MSARALYSNPSGELDIVQSRDYETKMGSDAPAASYTISYKETSGVNPYVYKTEGDIYQDDPYYVNWYIEVNSNKDLFKSITVVDTFYSGQEFVLLDDTKGVLIDNINRDYFRLRVEGTDSIELSIREFIDYTVQEVPIDGYDSILDGDMDSWFTFTNSKKQSEGKLASTKTSTKETVSVGDKFEYSISVSNTEKDSKAINNVIVSDTLPKGIIPTNSNVYLNGIKVTEFVDNSFTYTIDKVEYGLDYVFTFEVIATIDAVGTRLNKATVTDPTDPTNPITPEVPVEVKPEAKLESTKTVDKSSVLVGEKFTYTISVNNTVEGSNPIKNVSVIDTLPNGIEFTEGKVYLNDEEVTIATGDTFTYVIPEVEYGKDYVFTFEVVATIDAVGTRLNRLFVKCWGMTPIHNELREIRKYLLFLFFNLNVIYDFLL